MSRYPREPVAVVGAGVQAPGGRSLPRFWDRLLSGRPALALYEHPELPGKPPLVVGRADTVDPLELVGRSEAGRLDRTHLLAMAAADEALAAVADRPPPERCAIVTGVCYGPATLTDNVHRRAAAVGVQGMSPFAIPLGMVNSVAAHLAMRYGFHGPSLTVATACASGADAIGHGVQLIRSGAADLVLAGGVDAMLSLTPLLGFYRTGALTQSTDPEDASRPFDRDRGGFVLAEGAGFVVLRAARSGSVEPLGWIVGYAASCDAHHIVAPRADGAIAARALTAALDDADVLPEEVSHVNAHGTGTKYNDRAEARVLASVFGDKPPPVIAVKGVTGHMIGGSGAVEAIASLMALRHGLLPPTAGFRTPDPDIDLDVVHSRPRPAVPGYAVSNSFGFGGHNAALVLAAPDFTPR